MNQGIVNLLNAILDVLPARIGREVVAVATVLAGIGGAVDAALPVSPAVHVAIAVVVVYCGVIAARGSVRPVGR